MGQSAQSAPAVAEYVCMGQDVQEVCPVAATQTLGREAGKAAAAVAVPVDWPALQLAQAMVEDALYVPTEQAVQVFAPATVSVLVMEPAGQGVQPVTVVPSLE